MFNGEIPENMVVDHRDGNPLNNSLDNLRLATRSQNVANSKKVKNVSSQYKGVSWNQKQQKWRAYINVDGRSKYLGSFDDEYEAHLAWCEVAEVLHGEFFKSN